jgi:transposase
MDPGGDTPVEHLVDLLALQRQLIAQLTSRLSETGSVLRPNQRDSAEAPQRRSDDATDDVEMRPDSVSVHAPSECSLCGERLSDSETVGFERRLVVDLFQVRTWTTEHVSESRVCINGHETTGTFPQTANAPVTYGPGIRALALYLAVHQQIPPSKVAQIIVDLLGCEISEADIVKLVAEFDLAR